MLKYILISFLIITNVYAYTCEEMGYTQTIEDCPNHGLRCPAEPEKMFCCDPCGNTGAFMYNERNCSPDDGLQLAGVQCGGGWTKCEQCTSEYKYNKDNCRSPKILAGVQCGNAYTQCVYPVNSGCVPTVGYIYYADGSCHSDYDDTKDAIGVIVDAAGKLIIGLNQYQTYWNDGTSTRIFITELKEYTNKEDALLDMDGELNTDIIQNYSAKNNYTHKATQYCSDKTEGNKKWFLPSLGQLNTTYNRISDIQSGLTKIPNATKITSSNFWSSSEKSKSNGTSWTLNLITGNAETKFKDSKINARCFSHFK